MQYTKLGNTGLDVSKLCLGCMSFGDKRKWVHDWVLDETQTREIIKQALDNGINFFDTANIYSLGTSEEYVGRALKDYAIRDEIALATKVFFPMHDGLNAKGLSRKSIMTEIDNSLKRLDTDYVDLYIIHRFDYNTPIEETMQALHDVVKSGKARYIGASAMYTWQFQKMQDIAEKYNLTKFVSMQNHMNLIYREDERELVPFCKDSGVAMTPYSPMAGGKLVRTKETLRDITDATAKGKYDHALSKDQVIIDRVGEIAEKYETGKAQIALAWLLSKDYVTSPIIGATKEHHIPNAVDALKINLTTEDIGYLEEMYQPHSIVGALNE